MLIEIACRTCGQTYIPASEDFRRCPEIYQRCPASRPASQQRHSKSPAEGEHMASVRRRPSAPRLPISSHNFTKIAPQRYGRGRHRSNAAPVRTWSGPKIRNEVSKTGFERRVVAQNATKCDQKSAL
jgi:hypothetical protein